MSTEKPEREPLHIYVEIDVDEIAKQVAEAVTQETRTALKNIVEALDEAVAKTHASGVQIQTFIMPSSEKSKEQPNN